MFQRSNGTQPEAGRIWTDEQLRASVREFLETKNEVAAVLLFEVIQAFARRTAHGGNRAEREAFVSEVPTDILYVRESTGTSRLELYDSANPFLPWLRTVLNHLWISHLEAARKAIVNSDLMHSVTNRPTAADHAADELPQLTEHGFFTMEVAARLVAATNTARLVVFLAMTGLSRHFPGWEVLVRRFEATKKRTLPKQFPSMAVEMHDTPRTRTEPLAREMGYRNNNTLTQTWGRACEDLRAAFPELVRAFPTKPNCPTPTGERS